jgi:hypothetical protein
LTTIHVIVLAQGQQTRLAGHLDIPKQCLPLAGCGGMPIILRTLLQLMHINRSGDAMRVTVVCHEGMANELRNETSVFTGALEDKRHDRACSLGVITLPDPGNSSLKGIARTLALFNGHQDYLAFTGEPDVTVVLLGDVIYSWRCLAAILDVGEKVRAGTGLCSFVTSSELGQSSGEVWGLSWHKAGRRMMSEALDRALAKHPPFHDTYQPGQMRHWLWALPKLEQKLSHRICDDYTKDIDRPDHLPLVAGISALAAVDDMAHGVTW